MKKTFLSILICFSLTGIFAQSTEMLEKISSKQDLSAEEFSANVQTAMSNPDYIVTAGDVYSLNYAAGGSAVSYTIPVDSTYKIRVANLAVLDVQNKTYLTVKKEIENIVIRNYPMSGVQFVLLNPATFTVVIKGEVTQTLEKKAWALTRVADVLKNGLTNQSSERNIVITDKSGKSKTIDLFKAKRDGDFSQNPYLRPGDVITIGRLERKVTISGEVERPGTYELLEGENLKDLIERYGNGLTEFSNTEKIGLVRRIESETKSGDKVYLDKKAIESNYKLVNGDQIEITSLQSLMPTIIVEGIIANPNKNEISADSVNTDSARPLDTSYKTYIRFYTGENYATLIRRISDIFNSYSDLKNSYIERNGEKIPLDIEHILYDAELMSDKIVTANDRLVIPYQQHLQNVLLTGEVLNVVEENAWPLRRLSTIIKDNLTPYSSTRNIKVKSVDGEEKEYDLFKASRDGDLSQNPYIRSGETIVVGRLERKVAINGEVERPGTYELLEGENLKDLIERYGNGLTEFADLSRIEILRAKTETSKVGEKFYLKANSIDDKLITDFKIDCYDTVYVDSFKNLRPSIFVEGAIVEGAIVEGGKGTELTSSNKASIQFNPGENYAFFVRNHRNIFTSVSDLENAYIKRNNEYIPINLNLILYDASYYSDLTLEKDDILTVPFKQFFVSVAGAVHNPGRYPFIPDRDYEYYVGLAGGFDVNKNNLNAVEIVDVNGKKHSKNDKILPEYTITAKSNSFLYYFNQYAPVITTILSVVGTTISVLAATNAF